MWLRNVKTELRSPQLLWFRQHPQAGVAVFRSGHHQHAGERPLQRSGPFLCGPGCGQSRHCRHYALFSDFPVHDGHVHDGGRGRQHPFCNPPRAKEVHPGKHHSEQLLFAPDFDGDWSLHAGRNLHGAPAKVVRCKRANLACGQQLHAHHSVRGNLPDNCPGHEPLYPFDGPPQNRHVPRNRGCCHEHHSRLPLYHEIPLGYRGCRLGDHRIAAGSIGSHYAVLCQEVIANQDSLAPHEVARRLRA